MVVAAFIQFQEVFTTKYCPGMIANVNIFGTTILAIIFQHFLIIQHRSESRQIKRCLISSITNLVHDLSQQLPNDIRLRILGNQEILEECQIWLEALRSAQSFFQILNFDNSCQKTRKIREQIFEVLSNFAGFLYWILSRIVDELSYKFPLQLCNTNNNSQLNDLVL